MTPLQTGQTSVTTDGSVSIALGVIAVLVAAAILFLRWRGD